MIRLDDVALSFGDVSVLSGITLQVEPGELVGLIGPNGAGKTTLLRTINGLLEPDSGEVWLDEIPVESMRAKEVSRTVATVPQDTHVGFSFRTEQIVEMGRTPHRSRLNWSDDDDPVDEAMERTETTHLRDRRVDDLSGGERQRVLLARALAQEPSALLLDEPTASLDINHQVRVLTLVAELVSEGRAALAAIHDLDLAARYCDRILLLHDGEICARGTPETVLRDGRLATAFETETAVTKNSVTGTATVVALDERPQRDIHAHVAGGGEGAATALRTLWRAGFTVSAGLVPEGDITAELANRLDIEVVTSPAFQHPDGSRREAATTLATSADVLVVTEGPGSDLLGKELPSPTVETRLASAGTAVARGDGGTTDTIKTDSELIEAVLSAVED